MNIEFYETGTGKRPVLDFLLNLDCKLRVKTVGVIRLLEEKGDSLREPFSKKIDDHIFELRIRQGSNIVRILYFYAENGTACLTNGFIKKTDRIPERELLKANRYRNDYLKRRRDETERS